MIPGSNLLNAALSVIAAQLVTYHQYTGTVQNDIGTDVATYAANQTIRGSWQPVPRRLYQSLGLDFGRTYVTFYASKDILDVERDVSGDQLTYLNKRYQVLQANDWTGVDGWTGVLVVQIGDENAR